MKPNEILEVQTFFGYKVIPISYQDINRGFYLYQNDKVLDVCQYKTDAVSSRLVFLGKTHVIKIDSNYESTAYAEQSVIEFENWDFICEVAPHYTKYFAPTLALGRMNIYNEWVYFNVQERLFPDDLSALEHDLLNAKMKILKEKICSILEEFKIDGDMFYSQNPDYNNWMPVKGNPVCYDYGFKIHTSGKYADEIDYEKLFYEIMERNKVNVV